MSKKLPGFENVRPPKPDMRDERVALAIARRIVDEVNLDDFYWTADEKEDRAYELAVSIVAGGGRSAVFKRLPHAWKWEGIEDHYHDIAEEIAREELAAAIKHWQERYA